MYVLDSNFVGHAISKDRRVNDFTALNTSVGGEFQLAGIIE